MQNLPPNFRIKHEQLSTVIDPSTNKPITEILGNPTQNGLTTLPSGGQRFSFDGGDICSFNHTGRFPVVCIYGTIFRFYDRLGNNEGGYGRPLTDIIDLPDGTKCGQFEGGHIHTRGDKAEPFPAEHCPAPIKAKVPPFPLGIGPAGLPLLFHQKWQYLCTQRDPDGNTVIEKIGPPRYRLSDNANSGQTYNFCQGELISVDNITPPCIVYGRIWEHWSCFGSVNSGWGRPISDEQDLDDGGRCSVFEGGHLHRYGDIVQPFLADECTADYKPSPKFEVWNKMPAHFQRKWTALSPIMHPHTRKSIVELMHGPRWGLNDNPAKISGQYFHFGHGSLVEWSKEPFYPPPPGTPLALTEPFAVYGTIFDLWEPLGGTDTGPGRPLCDERDLPDGGRCSVFERGHIHLYNGQAKEIPANECAATWQPTEPIRYPRAAPTPVQAPPQQAMQYPPPQQQYSPPPQQHQQYSPPPQPVHYQPMPQPQPQPQMQYQGQPPQYHPGNATRPHPNTKPTTEDDGCCGCCCC